MRRSRIWLCGPLLFLVMSAAGSAHASDGQDRVNFARTIVIEQDESVADVVCFACNVENHGRIHGDVVTFLGGIKSDGSISGDVVSFLGDISLTHEASVQGDLVIFAGNLHKSGDAHVAQDQVVFPLFLVLVPFIILAAIIWGIVHLVRRPRLPLYMPTNGR